MRRRDMGNEVIVALAAIGMLALALTFGIVLTLSRTVLNPNETATQAVGLVATTTTVESVATAVATAPATAAATLEATDEATVASTQAATQAATESGTASATPSQTPTEIAKTSTVTHTPTSSETSTPSRTQTSTHTSTPSATVTATKLPSATFTLVALSTSTRAVPTDPPATGILPTNTPTATIVPPPGSSPIAATATPTATVCALRNGWVVYTVQQGDTLFSISRQADVTLAEMQQANCIVDPAAIYWGQLILIPPGRIILTSTPATSGAATIVLGNGNSNICPDATARITNPISGSALSGVVTITGTANIPNFSYFVIDYRPEINSEYSSFGRNLLPVTNGVLARFDPNPSGLPMGRYAIQLRVINTSGTGPAPCVVHFTLSR